MLIHNSRLPGPNSMQYEQVNRKHSKIISLICSDLPSPTFQSAGTLAAPCKYIGTGINLEFCLPFPFYYILPPYPLKAFFFFPSSPQKHTNGNCSIWRMVFVAGVVTLSVGVLMVVTNLKGRIQVTIHLIEVLFFSQP